MTSLVTGNLGFLGKNLVKRLEGMGHRVLGLDLKAGQDITKPIKIEEDIDIIWNLACIASPKHYIEQPFETLAVNTIGIFNVCNLALEKNAVLIHTSSSEIYGDSQVPVQNETYRGNVDPQGTHAPYKEGKRIAETIISTYRMYGLDYRIARIFNTYGPEMDLDDGRMITEFIVKALKNEPLIVQGGSQTRSVCYVDDLINGLILLAGLPVRKQTFNLGNPEEKTVLEYAQKVIDLTHSESDIKIESERDDDVKNRCPDISKANKILSWYPKTTLDDGLEKTIEWVRGQL